MNTAAFTPRNRWHLTKRALTAVVLGTLLESTSAAQGTWMERQPTTRPGSRMGHAMAYDAATLTPLPRGLGRAIFPTPFAGGQPQPSAIANTLGYRGTLGAPTFPSSPAPTELIRVGTGLRQPIVLAFQGLLEDDGSGIPERISLTNAIILQVQSM